jgi:hypothetical protein
VGAQTHPLPSVLALVPGETLSCDLRVRNSGTRVDRFTFEVLGGASAWTAVSPSSLSLLPGAEGTVTIQIQAPRAPSTLAGTVPFGLRGISDVDPEDTAIERTDLEIAPFVEAAAELIPGTFRARRRCQYTLFISNLGNTQTETSVTPKVPDQSLDLSMGGPPASIGPGEIVGVRMRARARQWIFTGQKEPRRFTVNVVLRPPGLQDLQAATVADGTLLQLPVLPAWVLLVVAAIVALSAFISREVDASDVGVVLFLVLAIGGLIAFVLLLLVVRLVRGIWQRSRPPA